MKMNKRSCFGWFELVAGMLLIALGIFTFIRPGSVLTWIILIYGFTALVMGIEDIVVYVKFARFTGFGPMLFADIGDHERHVRHYDTCVSRGGEVGAYPSFPDMVYRALYLKTCPHRHHQNV